MTRKEFVKMCTLLGICSVSLCSCDAISGNGSKNQAEERDTSLTDTAEVTVQSPDPQVALDFINAYVENANTREGRLEIRDWFRSSESVTEDMRSALIKMIDEAWEREPEIGLSYDPVFNAQDYPEKGFELKAFDEKQGLVTVEGIEWPGFSRNIRIVIIDGKTLVDGCGVINMPENMPVR